MRRVEESDRGLELEEQDGFRRHGVSSRAQ
jgi:hypothetical protein